MQTVASKIVWGLINAKPRNPYCNVYNEKRKGYRSFKVKDWNQQEYANAVIALTAVGINAKVVVTPLSSVGGCGMGSGGNLRLHVYEK